MRPETLSLVLLLPLTVLACPAGDDDDDTTADDDDDASDDDDAGPDAPTVDSNISNGQRGVLKETPLVLTFSEPMNTGSVEAAWTSQALPRGDLDFVWNVGNTILTIDLSEHLFYPAGDENVDVFDYEIEIDTSAGSEAGVTLESPFVLGFTSARDVTMALARFDDGTGSYNGSATGVDVRVGDGTSNETWRGFVSVDLGTLPPVVELTSASFFIRQSRVEGHPYTDLGDVTIEHLAPLSTIDISAWTSTGTALGIFSDSEAQANPGGDRSMDVTASLRSDLDDGASVISFRLGFEDAQDGENDDDYAIFDRTSMRMDVRLLAE